VNVADADWSVCASIRGIRKTSNGRQTGLVSSIAGPRRILPEVPVVARASSLPEHRAADAKESDPGD
jgi:hypothetical protein